MKRRILRANRDVDGVENGEGGLKWAMGKDDMGEGGGGERGNEESGGLSGASKIDLLIAYLK